MKNEMPDFAVGLEQQTPPLPEPEKENGYLNENIGCVVSEAEALKLAQEKLAPFFFERMNIPVSRAGEFEGVYQEYLKNFGSGPYPYGTPDANAYQSYQDLRNADLSQNDILSFIQVAEGGLEALSRELMHSLIAERGKITDFLNRPEIKAKIGGVFREINTLFRECGVTPSRTKLPLTQFLGKFERIFLESKKGFDPGITLGKGEFDPELDASIVQLDPSEEIRVSDLDILIAAHENFHGLSSSKMCGEAGRKKEKFDRGGNVKTGFFTKSKNNPRRSFALLGLNEGVTELFARVVSAKAGLEVTGAGSYNSFVKDALVLVQLLHDMPIDETLAYQNISYPVLADLLKQYGSETGILALGRELDEKIGPKGLIMFDILSADEQGDFRIFARSLRASRAGLAPEEVTIDPDHLPPYRVTFDELKKQYPFLVEKNKEKDGEVL